MAYNGLGGGFSYCDVPFSRTTMAQPSLISRLTPHKSAPDNLSLHNLGDRQYSDVRQNFESPFLWAFLEAHRFMILCNNGQKRFSPGRWIRGTLQHGYSGSDKLVSRPRPTTVLPDLPREQGMK